MGSDEKQRTGKIWKDEGPGATEASTVGRIEVAYRISYEKGIELKPSGNEVYYAACSLLVIFKNLCSKLHCQTGFNLIPFSSKLGE